MNTKTIASIFIIGIIILGGLSFFILVRRNSSKMQKTLNSTSSVTKYIPGTKDTIKLIQSNMNVPVIYSGNSFTPSKVQVKKGGIIGVTNTSKNDITVQITGKINALFPVKSGQTTFSPVLSNVGSYQISDVKNPKINGMIIVE